MKSIQLKENNIMEVAKFLNSNDFWAITEKYCENSGTSNIPGIVFSITEFAKTINETEWDIDVLFNYFVFKVDGEFNTCSEEDFKSMFGNKESTK